MEKSRFPVLHYNLCTKWDALKVSLKDLSPQNIKEGFRFLST